MSCSQLIIEGLPAHTQTGKLFRWILDNSALKKQQIGKIEILNRTARIDIDKSVGQRLAIELHAVRFVNTRVDVWYRNDNVERPCDAHFKNLNRLLELESKAASKIVKKHPHKENAKSSQHSSSSLVNLVIAGTEFTIGARRIVILTPPNPHEFLPYTQLRVGSPVVLSSLDNSNIHFHGIVSSIRRQAIEVTVNRFAESTDISSKFRIELSDEEIARQREELAMSRVRNAENSRPAELRDILLGNAEFSFSRINDFSILDQTLNNVQKDAVRFAVSANDIALIHGPPGTGKTTVVAEIIRQAVRSGQKVLTCAPSNLAVDNIVQQLLAFNENVVRLGNPTRVSPHLRQYSLDGMVSDHKDLRRARKLFQEADQITRKLSKRGRTPTEFSERKQLLAEADELKEHAHKIEADALESILNSATVICSTLHGVDADILGPQTFDVLVVDEACQATEPATWIPTIRCQKIILAGDPHQLPPTVKSPQAAEHGLNTSLLEKLINQHKSTLSRQLTIQFRMHNDIMKFSSQEFYDNLLIADASISSRLLADLEGVIKDELTEQPVHFIDTAGGGFNEEQEIGGTSIQNVQEANLVIHKVEKLIKLGVQPQHITVLSPYTAQVRYICESIGHDQVKIASIDGFQGRENEVVVISLVRSNPKKEVGFLADVRRMNVALTRARRKLIVIGDSATITAHPFYERLLNYFDGIGAYYGIWDEVE